MNCVRCGKEVAAVYGALQDGRGWCSQDCWAGNTPVSSQTAAVASPAPPTPTPAPAHKKDGAKPESPVKASREAKPKGKTKGKK